METVIQKAEIADMDLILQWRMEVLNEVFSIPANQNTDVLRKENYKYYKKALEDRSHVTCFALIKDEIIGCGGICFYQEMPSPDNPTGWCAYLMNIYTRLNYRGMGVGEKVVEWLISQAKQRGITKIYLETSEAGKKLYQKIGFSDMSDMMKLVN